MLASSFMENKCFVHFATKVVLVLLQLVEETFLGFSGQVGRAEDTQMTTHFELSLIRSY